MTRWGGTLALAAGAAEAHAAESNGFDLQSLYPAPAGDRFHLTEDGEVPGDGTLAARVLGAYAYKSLLSRSTGGETEEVLASQLYLNAGASYALSRRWLFALDVPWTVAQGGIAEVRGSHLSDLRLAVRSGLFRSDAFALGAEIGAQLPTGSSDALTGDESVRARLHLAASGRVSAFVYATNVGYLARGERGLAETQVGPALPFSAAAGAMLLDDSLSVSAELTGSTLLVSPGSTALFGLLGARYRVGSLVIGGGLGPGLSRTPGVGPRILFSLAWEPKAPDRDPAPPKDEATPATPPDDAKPAPVPPPEPAPAPPPEPPPATPPAEIAPPPPPPVAPAPPPPALSEEQVRDEARRLFTEGVQAFDAGQFAEAATAFGKALALKPHPTVLRNLAQSELMAGQREAACKHFTEWKSTAQSASAAEVSQVNQGLKQVCKQ